MELDVRNLHPLEIKLLRYLTKDSEVTAQTLIEHLDYNVVQCNQSFSWLTAKGYLKESSKKELKLFEITPLGKEQQKEGTPAQKIFKYLNEKGDASLPTLAEELSLERSDVGSAFGILSKAKAAKMGEGNLATALTDVEPKEIAIATTLLTKALEEPLDENSLNEQELSFILKNSKKRGASDTPFKIVEREEISYKLTEDGLKAKEALVKANISGNELGVVTNKMLSDGSWKNSTFRPYSLKVPPARLMVGRRNPYAEYLQWVKDKLVALGFEEFDGPLVESEFWNGDALFMPQFHSARDIHDCQLSTHLRGFWQLVIKMALQSL